jgi:magnesium chelatase family protein
VVRQRLRTPHGNQGSAAGSSLAAVPASWPGEISLGHKRVLFLDELSELSRPALEALRQPLKTDRETVACALGQITYPAFQVILAMNP